MKKTNNYLKIAVLLKGKSDALPLLSKNNYNSVL